METRTACGAICALCQLLARIHAEIPSNQNKNEDRVSANVNAMPIVKLNALRFEDPGRSSLLDWPDATRLAPSMIFPRFGSASVWIPLIR